MHDAVNYFKEVKRERHKFEKLVDILRNETDQELIIHTMIFINCLINTITNLDERIAIRTNFTSQGIERIIQV